MRPQDPETRRKWAGDALCGRSEEGQALASDQKISDLPLGQGQGHSPQFDVSKAHLFLTRHQAQCWGLTGPPAPTDWDTVDNECILRKETLNGWPIHLQKGIHRERNDHLSLGARTKFPSPRPPRMPELWGWKPEHQPQGSALCSRVCRAAAADKGGEGEERTGKPSP